MKWLVRWFFLVLFLSLISTRVFGETEEGAAATRISEAKSAMASAFEAVLEAENVGVNISDFQERLNHFGSLLASAEMLYRNGNYSGAVYYAGSVSGGCEGMKNEAVNLANYVAAERGQMVLWTVGVSALGFFGVLIGGFLGWGYVKKWYVKELLEMKPEVKEDDEH